ncbi:MAG TPA: SulP family inorganic anion transporter [Rhizobiaceae bacterium]|nr:SulP family inorganic anion transporter [Rhizobiaceae bacterium]
MVQANAALSRLPFAQGLDGYQSSWLRDDISAGLAIAAVGLPSAIAYPAIAGLPPETGIYASIAPLVAYALFGPSKQLIVGPDAGTMTVLAAAMATILAAAPGADPVALAGILAMVVGALCLIARVLRLGILASFLSRPILIGFFAGISLSILVGQIGRLTGLSIEADGLIPPLLELVRRAGSIHWLSLILALSMFALLQVAAALKSPVPGPVLVVVLSILLSFAFDLQGQGVAVVGNIPAGLPGLHLPGLGGLPLDRLLSGAVAIFLVSFGSGIVTARSFGAKGGYRVDANRELLGFGAANLAAGAFGAFPVTASDSRTAINATVGGRSQIAGIVAAMALVGTLLFLSPALKVLPIPALGAILVAAAISLIDIRALRQIWRISPMEFGFALIALLGPISLGVLNGVIVAVGATLLYVLRKMMFPRDAMLGRKAGWDGFYKLHRDPLARPVPGFAVWLIQGSLLFFNAEHVETRLRRIVRDLPERTEWFILDAGAIVQVDSTGAAMLDDIRVELSGRGVALGFAELHAEARALLERAGVIERTGDDMVFDNLDEAFRAFETRSSRKLV